MKIKLLLPVRLSPHKRRGITPDLTRLASEPDAKTVLCGLAASSGELTPRNIKYNGLSEKSKNENEKVFGHSDQIPGETCLGTGNGMLIPNLLF